MNKQFKLTNKGISELKTERDALVSQRSEVADRIKTAREFGDLSENAEYSAARQEQERNENRISEIEHILLNAETISQPKDKKIVELGNTVVLSNGKAKKTFTIVGSVEADPLNGKVSNESPIGKNLIGKNVGDEVEIVTPSDTIKYKIAELS